MKKYKYPFYIMFHPLNGFEEMKYRNGYSVFISVVIFIFAVMLEIVNKQFTGNQIAIYDVDKVDLLITLILRFAVIFIWAISNWSFCVLMDGKGTFSKIWVISNYSLVPYIVINYICIILSNVLIREESVFLSWLIMLGILWSVVLIITGIMAIHEFTFSRTIYTIILTLLGMLIILFVIFLIFSLFQQVTSTIITIFNEIAFRLR